MNGSRKVSQEVIEAAALAIAEYNACGHCDGSCGACSGEAKALADAGLLVSDLDSTGSVEYGVQIREGEVRNLRDLAACKAYIQGWTSRSRLGDAVPDVMVQDVTRSTWRKVEL